MAKQRSLSSVHLDAVRGSAALVVMLGHARVLFFSAKPVQQQLHASAAVPETYASSVANNMAANKNSIGHEAVMVFFVLSGFLVGGSALKLIRKNLWSWKEYLLKRLTRLWMVLIPALLLGMIFDYAGLHLFDNVGSIYNGPAGQPLVRPNLGSRYSIGILLGNMTFLQNICIPTAGSNVALWSLSNEFWYYIAFPFLVLGLVRNTAFWKRALFMGMFAGIMLGIGSHSARLFLVWAIGALISILPLKVPRQIAVWGAGLFAALSPVAFVWVKKHIASLAVAEFAIGLMFAGLLYLMLHQTESVKQDAYSSISAFIAKTSYTLYLVHVPILIFLCGWVNNPWQTWPRTLTNISCVLAVCVLTVVLAYAFYLLFEAKTDVVRNFVSQRMAKRQTSWRDFSSSCPDARNSIVEGPDNGKMWLPGQRQPFLPPNSAMQPRTLHKG